MSHRKTIPLPGYADRPGGLVEEADEPHAVAALPAPARRKTPFSGPASPRGYRSRPGRILAGRRTAARAARLIAELI